MSILRRVFNRDVETRDVGPDDGYGEPGYGSWHTGMRWQPWANPTMATADQAMRLSAVFGCLRLLSEAIATLPIDTFIRDGGTRRPYRPRPNYLNFQPPQQSRTSYLSQVMLSLLTDGNAFVGTPRDEYGDPVDLVVLDPASVEVHQRRNVRTYTIAERRYDAGEIMHIAGMTMPGELRGVSPLTAAREVIDGGRKAQEYGRQFMNNSAIPPAVIEMPGGANDEATESRARRIAHLWNDTNGGAAQAGKVGVLIGAQLKTIAVNPADAQWLESKRFGVSEIARFYGVPPHLIADATNSTSWGSGLAEQNLAFGQFSLRPWTERIEEAHGRLLTTHGLPDVFLRLNLDALLRASLSDRYASYAVGIQNGFLLPNEARSLEDLPPLPDGGAPTNVLGGERQIVPPTTRPGGAS